MHITAILLAAGKGIRFSSKTSKPLVKIASKPVIIHSLQKLAGSPYIKDIIVVANAKNKEAIKRCIKRYRIAKIKDIVKGGKRRQDSVRQGLKAAGSGTDFVLIHDSARPLIENDLIVSLIKKARVYKAAIAGAPVKFTVKKISKAGFVEGTVPRKSLWEIQTPQVFEKDLLCRAFARFSREDVTDDSSLVEKLGCRVYVVRGCYSNIKITTPEDIMAAEALLKSKRSSCRK